MIRMAIYVSRAVELDFIRPALGLTKDSLEVNILEALPENNSAITKNTFLLFKPLKFFFISHYQTQDFLKAFNIRVSQFYISIF